MSNRLAKYVKLASAPAGLATAATVGVPAQTASADIVVYDVGQSLNQQMSGSPYGAYFALFSDGSISLGGVESLGLDFTGVYFRSSVSSSYDRYGYSFGNRMSVNGGSNVLILGSGGVASPLAAGEQVGASGMFSASMVLGYSLFTTSFGIYGSSNSGGFRRDGTSYLGIAFEAVPGVMNYGWVEINWDGLNALEVVRWAYEDDGSAIEAGAVPAPGAVGLLALAAGAAGVRRKRVG